MVDLGVTPGASGPKLYLYLTLCPTLSGLGKGTDWTKREKVLWRAKENYDTELRLSQTEEVQCRFHVEEIGSH